VRRPLHPRLPGGGAPERGQRESGEDQDQPGTEQRRERLPTLVAQGTLGGFWPETQQATRRPSGDLREPAARASAGERAPRAQRRRGTGHHSRRKPAPAELADCERRERALARQRDEQASTDAGELWLIEGGHPEGT